jgi:hypothetical protein
MLPAELLPRVMDVELVLDQDLASCHPHHLLETMGSHRRGHS